MNGVDIHYQCMLTIRAQYNLFYLQPLMDWLRCNQSCLVLAVFAFSCCLLKFNAVCINCYMNVGTVFLMHNKLSSRRFCLCIHT